MTHLSPFARVVWCLALASVVGGCALGGDDAPARKPNIVLIMADDLGWAELGSFGQTKIRTPHLDALAAAGTRVTQHYAGAPVCAPSRSVLLTGQHSGHTVVRNNWEAGGWGEHEPEGQFPLPAGTTTLGTLLQSAGYATAAIGKWGLGGPGSTGAPDRQGFDLFYGYLCQRVAHNLYPTHLWRNDRREDLPGNVWGNHVGQTYSHDLMAEEALRFVDEHADEPFFLYLPFHIPHLALQVPEDSLAEYVGQWDDPPYEGGKGYLPHPTPRAAYAAMVTRMDRDIGRLVARIEALGLAQDTLFVFTSDNGATYDVGGADSPFFGSHGEFRGAKGRVYEGGLRVPLIVRWDGRVPAGAVSDQQGALQDWLPTLFAAAGVPAPADTDGIDLLPGLRGEPDAPAHEHLYFEFPGYGGQQMVRWGDWSAVRRDLAKGRLQTELYDLSTDIGQQHDVAAEHPGIVARLEAIMAAEHVPSPDFPLRGIDTVVD